MSTFSTAVSFEYYILKSTGKKYIACKILVGVVMEDTIRGP
jgi:hypothetical protein